MPRRVAAVIANNGGYFGYSFWQESHFPEVYRFNHLILGQHVIYKINFVVLSLVFLGVAFTVARSVLTGQVGKTGREEEKEKRTRKRRKKSSEKSRAGRFRKRRGESQSFLFGDVDQESETRMSKNALRTGRRQAVE
ncbi:hypothetical protein TNCV_3861501 [Trichonephila clavipes]|nr:hypothetical protein TNCV_3861501 [Trichonephila clavipes]